LKKKANFEAFETENGILHSFIINIKQ